MTRCAALLAALITMANAAPAHAQQWPERPVRLVVPYQAGGNVDIVARVIGEKLQGVFNQPFVVENRPGAGGMIATDYVAKSADDGYTLEVGVGATVLFTQVMLGRADYDWRTQLAAIGSINLTPVILEVRPDLPPKTVKEFLQLAKQKRLNFELGGQGSINQLLSELMQDKTGVKWETIVYKGNAPGMTALISGECDFSLDQISVSLPFIKAGQLRPIALSARSRSPLLPEVPTFAEQGFPDFEAATFTGLFGPVKMPKAVIDRLAQALAAILKSQDVLDRFASLGSEVFVTSPAEFAAYVARENERWLPFVKRISANGNRQ